MHQYHHACGPPKGMIQTLFLKMPFTTSTKIVLYTTTKHHDYISTYVHNYEYGRDLEYLHCRFTKIVGELHPSYVTDYMRSHTASFGRLPPMY